MAEDYGFNEAFVLGDGAAGLTRAELLGLARGLCSRLMETDGEYHGCVHPNNISRSPEGEIGLGPVADHAPGDWTSDELEYMAPELFWENGGGASSDVYSVALLIYAGLNKGRLPFVTENEPKPQDRVMALRRRLSGDTYPLPSCAGKALGTVLLKALSYRDKERYSGPAEFLTALAGCPDEEEEPFSAFVPAAESLVPEKPRPKPSPGVREYKVDKSTEEPEPPRHHRNWKIYIILGIVCVGLILLALVVKFFIGDFGHHVKIVDSTPPPVAEGDRVKPSPKPPKSTPTSTPTPPPTAEPESTYTLYIENVSWTAAKEACEARGGHLVTISDSEEFKKVTDLAENYGAGLVWVGFSRDDESGALKWVNDEDIQYFPWGVGEPSLKDTDGTPENYGLLWNHDGTWIYNDSRNDPVKDYPDIYSGKIAYVCEFDPQLETGTTVNKRN